MYQAPINTKDAPPLGAHIENQASLYNGNVTIQLGTFGRKRHAYFWVENGLFVPGTTSITRRLDKPALIPWAAKMASEYVSRELNAALEKDEKGKLVARIPKTRIKEIADGAKAAHRTMVDDASEIGKQVHELANRIFRGEIIGDLPANTDQRILNGLAAIRGWLRQNDVTPLGSEQIVFSRKWYYAGTYDLLATVNGRLAIVDFKTSKGVYTEHKLQTAGYQVAWEEEHQEPVNDRWAIRLDKHTGAFEAHHFPRSQLEMDTFLRLKEIDENLKKMDIAA